MNTLIVPLNISAPSTFTIVFQRGIFCADLTTVTAITFDVLRRDGSTTSLIGTVVAATSNSLVAQYTFSGGELTGTGAYYLAPVLSVPGGAIPAETITMIVDTPFTCQPQLETTAWLAATAAINTGPLPGSWFKVSPLNAPYTATRMTPFIATDLRASGVVVTLWTANDGDSVVFSDIYAAASGGHPLVLNGASGQLVPTGTASPGAYSSSGAFTAFTSGLRLKYSAALNSWLQW